MLFELAKMVCDFTERIYSHPLYLNPFIFLKFAEIPSRLTKKPCKSWPLASFPKNIGLPTIIMNPITILAPQKQQTKKPSNQCLWNHSLQNQNGGISHILEKPSSDWIFSTKKIWFFITICFYVWLFHVFVHCFCTAFCCQHFIFLKCKYFVDCAIYVLWCFSWQLSGPGLMRDFLCCQCGDSTEGSAAKHE